MTEVGTTVRVEIGIALFRHHAFNGCNLTSAFVEQDISKGFTLLKQNEEFRNEMCLLGSNILCGK